MAWFKRSPWVLHYNATSCNGCDTEVIVSLTPLYDLERFGIINTGNPKHADILLATGSVNEKSVQVLKTLYDQMPNPKAVVAVGLCAISGCVFQDCYNVMGGVDKVVPVDVYVPGCAARPESIIDGVIEACAILEKKHAQQKKERSGSSMSEPQEITPIGKNDLVGTVARFFAEGYRLVQIGCSTLEKGYEVNYSFDKEYRLKNLRVTLESGEEIPSISAVYANAFLYENEIHDLFGVVINNINIDYGGTLYRTAIKTPFSVENVKLPEPPKQKAGAPSRPADKAKQQAEAAEAEKAEAPEAEKE